MNLLTESEGDSAVSRAVAYVEEAVTGMPAELFPVTGVFAEKRGVFVTLTCNGDLRGCIGYPYPYFVLGSALKDAACQAAMRDPRFYPVSPAELKNLDIEVTVLGEPADMTCPAQERPAHVRIGTDGLIAEYEGYRGLLLPQVALEFGWNAEQFLDQTCIKAGLPPKTWEQDDCVIQTFEGQIFSRKQPWQ